LSWNLLSQIESGFLVRGKTPENGHHT